MHSLEITTELKTDIETNQNQLQNAIRNHQLLIVKVKEFPQNYEELQKEVKDAENLIMQIGINQKSLLDKLRKEYIAYQTSLKATTVQVTLEERKTNLNNSLNRARKQNLLPRRRTPPASVSDESEQGRQEARAVSPPEPPESLATVPTDLDQSSFLSYFRLATHEVHLEMQKKRAERKRRSTANPHFLYGNKGWDFGGPPTRRKRNNFLAHPPSPPNTRGRKKQETVRSSSKSPPTNGERIAITNGTPKLPAMLTLPNLPSGLVIERVNQSDDTRHRCIVCKEPGALSICARCSNGFHMSCHNRPFAKTPRECPKCLVNQNRRSTSSSSVSSSGSAEIAEKLQQKRDLQERRKDLAAELTQLQNCHSELTISLKKQEAHKQELKNGHKETEMKVKKIIDFVETVKTINLTDTCNS